jgi:hypothetical protein
MTYREFAEHVKTKARRRARDFTEPTDDWPMTVVAEHPGEPPNDFDVPNWIVNSNRAKDALAVALAESARLTKPTKVALISSAWVIQRPLDQPLPDKPPSEHPDRREVVIAVVADAERSEAWMAGIKRFQSKPPTLGAWESSEPGVGGRLFEPLIEALR